MNPLNKKCSKSKKHHKSLNLNSYLDNLSVKDKGINNIIFWVLELYKQKVTKLFSSIIPISV